MVMSVRQTPSRLQQFVMDQALPPLPWPNAQSLLACLQCHRGWAVEHRRAAKACRVSGPPIVPPIGNALDDRFHCWATSGETSERKSRDISDRRHPICEPAPESRQASRTGGSTITVCKTRTSRSPMSSGLQAVFRHRCGQRRGERHLSAAPGPIGACRQFSFLFCLQLCQPFSIETVSRALRLVPTGSRPGCFIRGQIAFCCGCYDSREGGQDILRRADRGRLSDTLRPFLAGQTRAR
jgi:hypothetical protein